AGGRRLGSQKRANRIAAEPRGRGVPGGGQAKAPKVKPVTQSRPAPQRQTSPAPTVPVEPVTPVVPVPETAPAPAPKTGSPGQLKNGK
ncbi:MAG TPA: hypothetical protein VJT68_05140, partial [Thermoleophilaceae bacterium]|nr:hypothetical protein [Thermoleophilaceae bacterium]